jgi:hypothetical protein
VSSFEALREAKRAADAALADAQDGLVGEYEAARDAYAADPGDDGKREAYKAAGSELAAYREVVREGRDGVAVAGDAFLSGGNEGADSN